MREQADQKWKGFWFVMLFFSHAASQNPHFRGSLAAVVKTLENV